MIILGIETSCDETACAILKKDQSGIHILSNVVASSAELQAKYGGVIPEQAAREQIKSIIPVIEEAIGYSQLAISQINAIAVTYGPGLVGSLLVGVETAKVLATIWQKPLVSINHLLGHFYANWITNQYKVESIMYSGKKQKYNPFILDTLYTIPVFPCIGLLVSGGHTDLLLFKDHGKYEYLGGTRDDAAGECFDKCARLLGLPYPGGPNLAKLAEKGNPKAYSLPRPMMKDFSSKGRPSFGWDFSFSGLKTAVANQLSVLSGQLSDKSSSVVSQSVTGKLKTGNRIIANLAASIEAAIIDVLVAKTVRAAQSYNVEHIMIAGGVAANQELIRNLKLKIKNLKLKARLFVPPAELCTDNAAMIATAAFFQESVKNPLSIQASPNLSFVNSP